ncbi:glycosyltransferase family 2 protein [Lentinula edodes]|uniref:Glycosyltransferase family 2 protein n=1 Tax=Lentinula edodes TaxID=5353 RepID=A0A1Q3E1A1_LENED|nr:glycosyltransferase family 2 protein [Lentinula edodes]
MALSIHIRPQNARYLHTSYPFGNCFYLAGMILYQAKLRSSSEGLHTDSGHPVPRDNDSRVYRVQTQGDAWFRPAEENLSSGVAIRVADDPVPEYRVFPYENVSLEPFEAAVKKLGPVVAVKVRSAAVHAAIAEAPPDDNSLYVDTRNNVRRSFEMRGYSLFGVIRWIQLFPTWYGRKRTVPVAPSITGPEPPRKLALYAPLYNGLAAGLALVFIGNGVRVLIREFLLTAPVPDTPNPEPTSMQRYLRFVLAVTLPFLYCVSLFFTLQILQNVTMAIGPIAHYHQNSRYYSAVPPKAPQSSTEEDKPEVLPHITIQMPVYRESLETVLAPSIASLKRAMQTYARQGGTSSIFVCDDGMRTSGMSKADRDERIRYYRSEGIGWVARPRDGCPAGGLDSIEEALDATADPEKGFGAKKKKSKSDSSHRGIPVFVRAGRFKKASNMNYGLSLSLCMERHLMGLVEAKKANAGPNSNANSTSSRGPSNLNPNSGPQARPTSSQLSHSRRISHSYPPAQNGRASPRVSHGTYGIYGMQYLNRDGDDMRVGGLAGNGNDPPPAMGSGNGIIVPTPTSGAFPSQTSPLMRNDPLGPGFANAVPGTPGPAAAEAYYELGMDPLGDLYGDEMIEDLEEEALDLAIEEMWDESRSVTNSAGWKPWAANGKAIRVGEIILLVDSDTVVPEDCLRDAAREMANSPNVAIIQHESDVMQVAHHYFENGIAYFTRRINRCISMACANGEIAPFVGHNAFLRWRAVQDASFTDLADNNRVTKEKMWSESNVSEDFDMALRLLGRGYDIRWATYSNGGFKEGVSLTVDDELNRWQKYAYGCNELLFNPLSQWWRRGPIARQIHRFIWSNAPVHYKISMMAYMFSYYGIAASITIGIINYVLLGGNVGYTLLEYRLGKRQLLWGFLENVMWIPFFFFFFGGLGIPVSQALLAHLFSYNITWSATVKEVERSNFFKEIPKIAKRFWFPLIVSFILIVAMIILSTTLVPIGWRIDGSSWAVIFPLAVVASCHILFPIVLNPWLMVFSY